MAQNSVPKWQAAMGVSGSTEGPVRGHGVSDYIPETPYMGRQWCPVCEPERDPSREILDTRWCGRHEPSREGTADDGVPKSEGYMSGAHEAGGDSNAAACALVRGSVQAIQAGDGRTS
jgi:hypothetical protein